MHFIAPARHELGTTLPINPRSNFARFSDGIPPLLDDCQLQVKKRSSTRSSGWMSWAWLKSGRLGECQAVRQSRYWPPALSSRLDEVAALEAGSKDGRDLLSGAGSCLGAEVEVASRRRPTFRGHDSRPLDSRPPSHPTGQTFYDPTHFIIVCKKLY